MAEPWDTDHSFDHAALGERLARSLASGRYSGSPQFTPDVAPRWVAHGWDCDVFRVTDDTGVAWLCKLPKRRQVEPWLRKEAAILDALAQGGFELAPKLALSGEPDPLPYVWIGISITPGRDLLTARTEVDAAVCGASFGAVMRRLHTFEMEALGERPPTILRRVDHPLEDSLRRIEVLKRALADANEVQAIDSDLLSRLRGMATRAAAAQAEEVITRFVHDDFYPEHVFVDPASSRVQGLIDWSDACWGDPASDFTPLAWCFGDSFLEPALDAYATGHRHGLGVRDLDAMRRRIHRVATTSGLYDITVASRGAPNVPLGQRIATLLDRTRDGWLERV